MADESPDLNLIKRENHRTITLSEVLGRIYQFINTCRGVEFVLVAHKQGAPLDGGNIMWANNVEPQRAREILRAAVQSYDKRGGDGTRIVRPFGT